LFKDFVGNFSSFIFLLLLGKSPPIFTFSNDHKDNKYDLFASTHVIFMNYFSISDIHNCTLLGLKPRLNFCWLGVILYLIIIIRSKRFFVWWVWSIKRYMLILSFGIRSNQFKLLCIEVISKHNILFLIDDWYYCFVCNALFSMISKLRFVWKVLLRFWPQTIMLNIFEC